MPTDACCLVAETLELLRASVRAFVTLTASISDAPLVVIGHAARRYQVVMNICNKSVQAMSAGDMMSVPRKGSVFSIYIPMAEASSAAVTSA